MFGGTDALIEAPATLRARNCVDPVYVNVEPERKTFAAVLTDDAVMRPLSKFTVVVFEPA